MIVRTIFLLVSRVVLFIDKKSKMLSRIAFSDQGNQIEDYSDYKPEGGIQVAHKRKSTTQGRVTQLDITKVEWDPKVDPAIFKKPEAAAPPAKP